MAEQKAWLGVGANPSVEAQIVVILVDEKGGGGDSKDGGRRGGKRGRMVDGEGRGGRIDESFFVLRSAV